MVGIDMRAPLKFKKGFGAPPGDDHIGGDPFQLWAPGEVYVDDVRIHENWYQGWFWRLHWQIAIGKPDYNNAPCALGLDHVFFGKLAGYSAIRYIVDGMPDFPISMNECYALPAADCDNDRAWGVNVTPGFGRTQDGDSPYYVPSYVAGSTPARSIEYYLAQAGDKYAGVKGFDNTKGMDYGQYVSTSPHTGRLYKGQPDLRLFPFGAGDWDLYPAGDARRNYNTKAGPGYR